MRNFTLFSLALLVLTTATSAQDAGNKGPEEYGELKLAIRGGVNVGREVHLKGEVSVRLQSPAAPAETGLYVSLPTPDGLIDPFTMLPLMQAFTRGETLSARWELPPSIEDLEVVAQAFAIDTKGKLYASSGFALRVNP